MPTAIEKVRELLDDIPEKATYEDIQYHIFVHQKIEIGLRDVAEGSVLGQKEVERRMSKWLKP